MNLSIVIPVYNEVGTVQHILERVIAAAPDAEIIIVNDGSTDGTAEALQKLSDNFAQVSVFHQETNQGKGAALRRGFQECTGDIVLIQDADLEYSPSDYPTLLAPILEDGADVVYGSRFLGGPHRVLFFWHYVGNRFLTLVSNMTTNLNLTDMETCYKVFRKEVLDNINIKSNRFGFEPEITIKVAKQHVKIYEVPIQYHGRTYEEGKKITWKDGVVALFTILRYRLFD